MAEEKLHTKRKNAPDGGLPTLRSGSRNTLYSYNKEAGELATFSSPAVGGINSG